MPSVDLVAEKFGVIGTGVPVFFGSRDTIEIEDLTPKERGAINTIFMRGIEHIGKISPKLRADIEIQRPHVEMVASAFKAFCDGKEYSFPSTGDLGVTWLFPSAITWAIPEESTPAFTSYMFNSWKMYLSAGSLSYIFGDGIHYFKTDKTEGRRFAILVFNNGIIEIGTSPKLVQFKIWDEGLTKYGAYTVPPTVAIPLEDGKLLYQYPTPMGALPVFYDKGIQWAVMPGESGISEIPLIGMVFYEHDFLSSPRWTVIDEPR